MVDFALLIAGAVIAFLAAQPAEAFALRFSTPETLVAAGLVVAVGLFVLRKYRKDIYGAVEVMVAVFALAISGEAGEDRSVTVALIGFMGAVYILVRGMTHFIEGRRERGRA